MSNSKIKLFLTSFLTEEDLTKTFFQLKDEPVFEKIHGFKIFNLDPVLLDILKDLHYNVQLFKNLPSREKLGSELDDFMMKRLKDDVEAILIVVDQEFLGFAWEFLTFQNTLDTYEIIVNSELIEPERLYVFFRLDIGFSIRPILKDLNKTELDLLHLFKVINSKVLSVNTDNINDRTHLN